MVVLILVYSNIYITLCLHAGVSNYIKDVILCMVSVQAELFLYAPLFASTTLNQLFVRCAQQLRNVCEKITHEGGIRATQVSSGGIFTTM